MIFDSEKILNVASLVSAIGLTCAAVLLSDDVQVSNQNLLINNYSEAQQTKKAEIVKTDVNLDFSAAPIVLYANQNKVSNKVQKAVAYEQISTDLKPNYTEEELDMLSRIIHAEAGSDCISDEHQQLVGMVVINRINDPRFPDTMEEVIMAKGQYDCVRNGSYYQQPSKRAIENAKKVLNGEVEAPPDMVYQAEFPQGYEVYKTFDTPWSTTYFCLG